MLYCLIELSKYTYGPHHHCMEVLPKYLTEIITTTTSSFSDELKLCRSYPFPGLFCRKVNNLHFLLTPLLACPWE